MLLGIHVHAMVLFRPNSPFLLPLRFCFAFVLLFPTTLHAVHPDTARVSAACFPPKVYSMVLSLLPDKEQLFRCAPEDICSFPFSYDGEQHTSCIAGMPPNRSAWGSSSEEYEGRQFWCLANNTGTNSSNSMDVSMCDCPEPHDWASDRRSTRNPPQRVLPVLFRPHAFSMQACCAFICSQCLWEDRVKLSCAAIFVSVLLLFSVIDFMADVGWCDVQAAAYASMLPALDALSLTPLPFEAFAQYLQTSKVSRRQRSLPSLRRVEGVHSIGMEGVRSDADAPIAATLHHDFVLTWARCACSQLVGFYLAIVMVVAGMVLNAGWINLTGLV